MNLINITIFTLKKASLKPLAKPGIIKQHNNSIIYKLKS